MVKGDNYVIEERFRKKIEDGGILIYLRKSRALGDTEDSLANHRMVLEQLCIKHGWSYVLKEEIGSSDTIEHREVFNEIYKEDIPSGNYSAIIVNDQARLSRNTHDFSLIKEALIKNDVLVIDRNERVFDYSTSEDDFISDLTVVLDKRDLNENKRRFRDGKISNAMKGKWVNGKAPYGYFYDKNFRVLVPDNCGSPCPADIVKSIYQYAINGVSTSDIAYRFNRQDIKSPKGGNWTSTTVGRILHQEVYLGKNIFGKSTGSGHKHKKTTPLKRKDKSEWIVVNNAHEPLISEDIFEEVQAQLNRRKKIIATRGKSKTTALKGLVKCGQCGSGLHIQIKDNGRNIIKSCWYKSPLGEKCSNRGIKESVVVKKLLDEIKQYRDEISSAIEMGKVNNTAKEAIFKEITALEKELKSVKSKQDSLDDFLEEGIYSKEKYLSRMEKLTVKEKDVQSDLVLLEHQLKKQEATKDKDKVKMLDMALSNIKSIENDEHWNKIFKSIIGHVTLKRVSSDDEGEIIVNFH